MEPNNPLSSKNILAGVIVTVVGGIILALVFLVRDQPPQHGAFIKEGRFNYVEIPAKTAGQEQSLRAQGAPVTTNRRPTIVLWEPQMRMDSLTLHEEIGGMGTRINSNGFYNGLAYPMITEISPGGGGAQAGILSGDLIFALNEISTANYTNDDVATISRGPVGTTLNVTIVRNGSLQEFSVTRRPIDKRGRIPFTISSEGDLMELTPSTDLSPGLYCFVAGSFLLPHEMLPYWCFTVQ